MSDIDTTLASGQQLAPTTGPGIKSRRLAANVDPRVRAAARGLFDLAGAIPERFDEAYQRAGWERMGRAAVEAGDTADRDHGMVRVSQDLLAAYEQMLGAVEELLDRCDRISPHAIVATSLVRTALATGQAPDLPTRYPDGGQHD
jgi:hypothetical protein